MNKRIHEIMFWGAQGLFCITTIGAYAAWINRWYLVTVYGIVGALASAWLAGRAQLHLQDADIRERCRDHEERMKIRRKAA